MKLGRHQVCRVAVLTAVAGTISFMEQDPTGLTRMHGLDAAQNIYRVGLFATAAATLGLLVSSGRMRVRRLTIKTDYRYFIALLTVYCLTTLAVITFHNQIALGFTPRLNEVARSVYFMVEWIIFFAAVHMYFVTGINTGRDIERLIVRLAKDLALFYAVVVLLFLLINFRLVFGAMGRLGGFVIHPNKLAVVGLIGAASHYLYSVGYKRAVAVTFFLIVAGFTLSRSVLLGGFLAILFIAVFGRASPAKRVIRLVVVGTLGIIGLLISLTYLEQLIAFAIRGQSFTEVMTFNNRTIIWLTSLKLFAQHPITGLGYYFGPKHLPDFYTGSSLSHWNAPHAHNEILNSLLSGGILAGLITGSILWKMFYQAFHRAAGRAHTLLLFSALVLLAHSLATPLLSEKLLASGVFFVVVNVSLIFSGESYRKTMTWDLIARNPYVKVRL